MTLCFCTGPCTAACCCRLQTFVHAITFQQLFGFLSIFAQLLALIYRLSGQILVIWFLTSSMNFQGQVWNLLYFSQKWFDCHKTKSKHIEWTLGLKCAHRVWPWPWPRPWNFKVKYGICYISTKNSLIATKRKANISIVLQASNVTNGFNLGHDLDIWSFKVKCDLHRLVNKVRCKDLPDIDRLTSNVDVSSTHLVLIQTSMDKSRNKSEN